MSRHNGGREVAVYGGFEGHGARAWGERANNFTLAELIAMLWREKLVMLLVAAVIAVAGIAAVTQMPSYFLAGARVLVLYDDAYLQNPVMGDSSAARSILTPQQIIQAETDFLSSDELKRRVVRSVGMSTLLPVHGAHAEDADTRSVELGVRALRDSLSVTVLPNSPTITVRMRHENPEVAALVANTMIDEYLAYRREVLLGTPPEGLTRERRNTEDRLAVINSEIESFLAENEIGDFQGERDSARARAAQIASELYTARARLHEVEGRLGSITTTLDTIPAREPVHVDNAANARLQELFVEREELLAGFDADSRTIAEIDARIERIQEALRAGEIPGGLTRVGPNPIYTTLMTERLQLQAEQASLQERVEALGAQLEETRARQQHLQQLAPAYDRLLRESEAVTATVRRMVEREEQSRAVRALAEQTIDTIRVVERATPPTESSSMRRVAGVGVILVAGFIGLLVGLIRAFARRMSANGQSEARQLHTHPRAGLDQPPPRPGGGRRRPRLVGENGAYLPALPASAQAANEPRPSRSTSFKARVLGMHSALKNAASSRLGETTKRESGTEAEINQLRIDAVRRAKVLRGQRRLRRSGREDAPGVQENGAVAEARGEGQVVDGDYDARAAVGAIAKSLQDAKPVIRVEAGRRLVERQERRVGSESARYMSASVLAAGYRADRPTPLRAKPDVFESPINRCRFRA